NIENLKINDLKIHIKNGDINDSEFTLVNKKNDKDYFVNLYSVDSNNSVVLKFLAEKEKTDSWAQYDSSINAEYFFNTLDSVKEFIIKLGHREYTIISTGVKEIQKQKANYIKWNNGEYVQIEFPFENENFAIVVIPDSGKEITIIYI
ncbi:hypothetical protein ACFOQM_15205, partial [Paenibacillus sp. GCM10012307]